MKMSESSKSIPTRVEIANHKWIHKLRVLPTNPKVNDFLKPEYIDTNLNNSRKLMHNISDLTNSSNKLVEDNEEMTESLSKLTEVVKELSWLG